MAPNYSTIDMFLYNSSTYG